MDEFFVYFSQQMGTFDRLTSAGLLAHTHGGHVSKQIQANIPLDWPEQGESLVQLISKHLRAGPQWVGHNRPLRFGFFCPGYTPTALRTEKNFLLRLLMICSR